MLANAALSLSFDQATYSISAPGQTSLVSVYLTQSAGGAQVGPGNTLISAALNLVFNSPGGIAAVSAVTDITPSALFDSSSRGVSATNATLGETSVAGISDLSVPLLLGTFKMTGLAAGSTTIQVASLGPGSSFVTSQGNIVDPTNAPTALVSVVPEPPSAAIAISALAVVGLYGSRRWQVGSMVLQLAKLPARSFRDPHLSN